jgi:hypothetical protein
MSRPYKHQEKTTLISLKLPVSLRDWLKGYAYSQEPPLTMTDIIYQVLSEHRKSHLPGMEGKNLSKKTEEKKTIMKLTEKGIQRLAFFYQQFYKYPTEPEGWGWEDVKEAAIDEVENSLSFIDKEEPYYELPGRESVTGHPVTIEFIPEDYIKDPSVEELQEEFVSDFYKLWEKEGFGARDDVAGVAYPWGMPWLTSVEHDLSDPEGYFESVKEEIREFKKDEEFYSPESE